MNVLAMPRSDVESGAWMMPERSRIAAWASRISLGGIGGGDLLRCLLERGVHRQGLHGKACPGFAIPLEEPAGRWRAWP